MTVEHVAGGFEPEPAAVLVGGRLPAAGVIFACTFGAFTSVTPAIISMMGVFLKPIAADFGWPRFEVAGALAASALGNAIACPFAGRLADRIGPRRTLLLGCLLFGLAILLVSQVPPQPLLYYPIFFLAGAAGSMPSALVFAKVLGAWFDKTRGLWMGFCSGIGIGLGSLLFPMFAAAMLATHGWRWGFGGVGTFILVATLPVMFIFLRNAPARQPNDPVKPAILQGISYREAIRSPRFWLIFSIVPVGGGCMTAMFSTIVPVLTDRGVPIDQAIMVIQAFAFTTIFVEPSAGWLADRTSSPKVIAPLFLTAALGLWMLLHVHSQGLLIAAGLLIGVGAGVEYTFLPYLISRYFGLKEFGAIAGIAFSGTLLVGSLAPMLLNGVYDLTGRYDLAIYGIIGILIYSSAAILTFGRYTFAAHRHA